jgi:glycosyltransferase involved in cell wall biosynthesis
VVSEQEKQLLSQLAPDFDSVGVIPNFIFHNYINENNTFPQSDHLIFTGPFRYLVNHDAMVWFLEEIYPLIQAVIPNVHLTITGDHDNLPLPAANNVNLTGFVEDIKPLIKSAKVNIVPIREGGGTRIKILESIALGVPVVSTSKGVEGLEVLDGKHLLIGDTPETFAQNVIRLLKDNDLRQDLIIRAQKLVKNKYDIEVVIPQFEGLVQKVKKNSSIVA